MDSEEDYCVESSDSEEDEDSNTYSSAGAGGDATDKSSSSDGVAEELHYAAAVVPRRNYRILNEDDLKRLRENDISTVSDTLCVSRGAACSLLCRNNWNPSAAYDDWFAAVDDKPPKPSAKRKRETEVCTICFDETAIDLISATCGHRFCPNCWRSYIGTSINDGPNCLTLWCPEPNCKTPVLLEMINSLSSDEDKKKYHQFLHRSYVESNPSRKWCPGPGCDFAVEFTGGEPYDVTCDCSFKFCWNCTEENHRPVDCETVAKWVEKNSSEAENATWILAHTKPCPKCRRSIEKNQGCNHMTCRCRFQFCWICLEDWRKHGYGYKCNIYKEKEEKDRKDARELLKRYAHFFERFNLNDKSQKQALLDSGRVGKEHVESLGRAYDNEPHGWIQNVVVGAWDQIVECRRVLKWSYAYGYYLSLSSLKSGKMRLFEYLQGQAETALERLHHCAEMEMGKYLNGDRSVQDFRDLLSRLAGLTSVSKTYFQNLVTALENNLSEVQR